MSVYIEVAFISSMIFLKIHVIVCGEVALRFVSLGRELHVENQLRRTRVQQIQCV